MGVGRVADGAGQQGVAEWVRAGRLRYLEDIADGIESAPGAIADLYRGDNLGKRLIRLRR